MPSARPTNGTDGKFLAAVMLVITASPWTIGLAGGCLTYPFAHVESVVGGTPRNRAASATV